ncbi:MAG TPA: hypothetical protein VG389_17370, partial [Myxococcota bacterium]|nr:hypothetical protein [Myxococcota bacterium]
MADPKNPKASHDDDLDVLGEIAEVEQLLPEPAAAPPGPAHDDADDGGVDPLGDFGLGESMDAPTDEDSGTGAGANGHAAASDAIGASLAETDALPDEVLAFDGEGRTQPDVGPSDELEEPHARTAREDSEAGATAEAGDASGAGVAQRRGDDEGHGAGPASTPEPPGAGAPHAPTYAVRRHDSSGFPMPASHADGDGATPSPGVYQSHESLVERVSAAPPRARAKTSPPPPPRRAQTSAAAVTRRADMTAATPSVAGAVRETTRGPIADPLAGDEPPPLAGATFGDGDYDVEVEQAGAPTSEAAPAATSTAPAPTSRASAPAAAPSIDALTGGAREDEDFEALMGLSFGGRPARRAPDAAPVQADAEVEIYIPEPGEGAPPQAPTDVTDGQHEAPPPPPGPGRMSLAERLRRSGALSELEADGEAADEGEVIAEADDAPTDLGDDPLTPMVPPDDALLAAAAAEPRMPPPPPSPAPRRAVPAPRPGGGPPVPPLPEGVWPRYVAELDMERAHRTSTEAAALAYEAQAASLAHVPGSDAEAARLATAASEASARFVPALYEAVHRALAAGNPAEAQRRLEAEIAATPDGGRRAWLEISRARIAEVVQHDDVAARAAWRRAAEAAPKETTPLVGVERMALAARDDAETLETWKKLGIEIRTNERKALYLVDFARLNERRGGDAELSIQALNRAFFADPADPFVLDELRATARRHERWGDVVATLAKEIGRLEQEEGRGRAVAEMHWRIAETYREHLGEAEAAWTSMEMALEFGPRHPAVLEAAVRMARGDATRAEAARRAFEALAESTAEPADRAAIWHELHVAAAAEWKDAALAEKALRAAVAADPPHRPSLLALEKLLLGAGRLGDLADVLASGAPPPGAPARDRAAHLVRLATLYHHHAAGGLGATDGATAAYGEALAADPGFFPAVAGLAAVLRREGRLPELEAHLTASLAASPARAEEIWLCDELAMLYRWEAPRLGGAAENAPQKAIESLARLGARDPERPRVLDRLAELHEQTGRWKELAELLEQGAAGQRDARARAALLLRAGRLRESRLDQTAAAAELYRAALDVAAAASA